MQLLASISGIALGSMLIVAALVAAGIAVRVWRERSRADVECPHQLLRELCRGHRLSFGQRRMVARLARSHRLTDPAYALLDPELWIAEQAPQSQSRRARAARRRRDALRDRLFESRESGSAAS